MRLWVDGQCLQTASRMRGIGRYVSELLRAIAEHHPEVDLSISFNAAMPDQALLAREAVSGIIRPENVHVWHGAAKTGEAIDGYTPERRLSELALSHHVNCLAPDVALSASPFEGAMDLAVPLLPGRGCTVPTAAIFYDAIPYRFKEHYLTGTEMSHYYQRRLELHSGFLANLCISDFSKAELQSILPNSLGVGISAGVSKEFIAAFDESKIAGGKNDDFVLWVGGLDWRKNVETVVKAFALLPSDDFGFLRLVIAGDAPEYLFANLQKQWAELGLSPRRLTCLGHVSEEQLVGLYKQARLLVQPSLMEGFGLTTLEAIHCGTPVLASRSGALPEVVGYDDYLFDPNSHTELAGKIRLVLQGGPQLTKALKGMKKHAARFNWKTSSNAAVDALIPLKKSSIRRPDLPTNRAEIALQCKMESLDSDIAANLFALAEPFPFETRRLLVDATSTVRVDHKSGIQRVVKRICASLAASGETYGNERHFVFCDDDSGWRACDGKTLAKPAKNGPSLRVPGGDLLLMLDSSWEFHALHRKSLRACRLRGGDVVSCLYDTVPLQSSAFCDPGMPIVFAEWFRTALTYSTGFVCISKAVADELLSLLEAIRFPRPMKVGYWQLGADFATRPSTSRQEAADAKERRPCFLMVGTLEPRKGHRVALGAFESLWANGADIELVIVGKVRWGTSHLVDRIRRHAEFGSRLHWHENASDGELSTLYDECDALIAASFAEGFGLPIVEAGHYGKPAIASDIPVFREVGKGAAAAHLFEMGDASALAATVDKFLKNKDGGAMPPRLAWPSWADSAAQLEDVVLGQKWYKTYEPRVSKPFTPLSDLGHTVMAAPLTDAQRAHRIDLVEGPYRTDDGAASKIIVKLTNLSEIVWSSLGETDGRLGIALSYHTLGAAAESLSYDNARTHIPFVLAPGDTHYMAVNVPMLLIERGAEFVDIELVQEGVSWFGTPLRVPL